MRRSSSILFAGALAAAWTAAAAEVDLSKLPPPAKKEGVTYAKDIKPIFEASCLGCHGEQRPRGGLRLDTLELALKGATTRNGTEVVIEPGKSDKSKLVIAVARIDSNLMMPPPPRARRGGPGGPGGGPGSAGTNAPATAAPGAAPGPGAGGPPPPKNLTPEEVGLVRAWIDQGAK